MKIKKQNEIIRNSIGFLAAILIHLLILLLFLLSSEDILVPPPKDDGKKIELDLSYFQPPPAAKPLPKPVVPPTPEPKPVPEPVKVAEPLPKPKVIIDKKSLLITKNEKNDSNETNDTILVKKKPKIIKKKRVVKKKGTKKKVVKKKIVKKPKKKIVKKRPPKKRIKRATAQRQQKAQPKQKSALGDALMGSGKSRSLQRSPQNRKKVDATTKKIIDRLYGSEFDSFGPAQKRFIENNLALIHKITQGTLSRNGYPEVAARTGQEGFNIVSFDLHPNGNITNLRLEHRMGYESLDRNTLQVIRIAYKDYPLPRKKTKIKFYVEYTIY